MLPEKNKQEKFNEIEKMDRTLRCIKSFIKHGTFKKNQLSSSVYVGCMFAYDLYEMLSSIEVAVVYEWKRDKMSAESDVVYSAKLVSSKMKLQVKDNLTKSGAMPLHSASV